MIKTNTMSVSAVGAPAVLQAGQLEIPKGWKARGLRLKTTMTIANSRAASDTTALTAAQKEALLADFQFTLKYGKEKHRVPFNAATGKECHWLSRLCCGTELQGYADSSTGLAKTLTANGNTTVVFYQYLPTGRFYLYDDADDEAAMGRTQLKTCELTVALTSDAIATGLAVNFGTVTLEVMPDLVSDKGDHWSYVPEFQRVTVTDRVVRLADGLPLLLLESTAVHASTSMTSVKVEVGEQLVHNTVSPAELVIDYTDSPLSELTSLGLLTDVVTVLYAPRPGDRFRTMPTGQLRFEQLVHNLSSAALGYYFMPFVDEMRVRADVGEVARLRGKPVRAVSLGALLGAREPYRLRPFRGFVSLDSEDADFELYSGLYADNARPSGATASAPPTTLAGARARYAHHKGQQEDMRALKVLEEVTAAVPGGVPSSRGFNKGGSLAFAEVRGAVAGS